jgi:polygalacturonase
MTSTFDIADYGASPDGKTMNTSAIQSAIDACHQSGGGTVVCGPGCFLTGSLELRSNVELHLGLGCTLVGSRSVGDYEEFVADGFRGEHAPERCTHSLIRAAGAENVAVTGPGAIDGSGPAFYDTQNPGERFFRKPPTPRPRMLMFYECRNVRLEDASLIDSPCWTVWLMKCSQVRIRGLQIRGDLRMINNDGIDLDSCQAVTVSDCIIRSGDDCVVLRAIQQMFREPAPCENVTVSNCVLESACQGIRIGCPGDGVIRNAAFSNLVVRSQGDGILFGNPRRYLPEGERGSADVHDIVFSNLTVESDRSPVRIEVEDGIELQRLSDLSFSNCRMRGGMPCIVSGSPETTIRDVSFSNVCVDTSGEGAVVCRYAEGLELTNVELSNRPRPS